MKTKLNRKIPALVFCLLFSCVMASAQQFTAKGVVVDSNGEPVIGGGVALKGTLFPVGGYRNHLHGHSR